MRFLVTLTRSKDRQALALIAAQLLNTLRRWASPSRAR
jgi:hypothetical protein